MSHDPSADQQFEFTPDMTPAEIHAAKEAGPPLPTNRLVSYPAPQPAPSAHMEIKADGSIIPLVFPLPSREFTNAQEPCCPGGAAGRCICPEPHLGVKHCPPTTRTYEVDEHLMAQQDRLYAQFPVSQWQENEDGSRTLVQRLNEIPADFPRIDIPEPDFSDLLDSDSDRSTGVPPFVAALEESIDGFLKDQPALDSANTASEIAFELLKHPALQGYTDKLPDCDYMHDGDVDLSDFVQDDPEAAHMDQWERYAEQGENMQGEIHFGVDWNGHVPTEQEFLGNVADGEARWDRRRPQLMAQAKAGIAALQELAGMAAEHKGFHEDRPVSGAELQNWQGNKLMLIVSEAVEAHDEIRTGHSAYETYYPTEKQGLAHHKPEGVPSEIADVVIRSADFAWTEGFDLADIIIEKLEFNATRAHKHGKAF